MKAAVSIDAFWRGYPGKAEELLQIAEKMGALDVASRRAKSTCINAAEMLQQTGVELVLAGLDDKAWRVFQIIPELAEASIEGGEKGRYTDVVFARYMAMRVAATAEWMLRRGKRDEYFGRMLGYLHEDIRIEAEKAKDEVRDVPQVGGRLAIHYAQAGRWGDILAMPELARGGGGAAPLWRSLFKSLRILADAKSRPDDQRGSRKAREGIDTWFLEHTSIRRFGEPWNPDLTSNDIVSIAEIRARWIHGVTDPWATVRSIRWPELVGLAP